MLLNKEKDIWVKFNPGLSANQPSNNWAQAPVVQKVGSAICWINLYLKDSAIGFPNTCLCWKVIYPVDSAIQHDFEQPGPETQFPS